LLWVLRINEYPEARFFRSSRKNFQKISRVNFLIETFLRLSKAIWFSPELDEAWKQMNFCDNVFGSFIGIFVHSRGLNSQLFVFFNKANSKRDQSCGWNSWSMVREYMGKLNLKRGYCKNFSDNFLKPPVRNRGLLLVRKFKCNNHVSYLPSPYFFFVEETYQTIFFRLYKYKPWKNYELKANNNLIEMKQKVC